VGFAPVSQTVSLSTGASTLIDFSLHPGAVPLNEVVTIGTRALERTTTGSSVPIDVATSALLENTGTVETWQQLQRIIPSLNVPHIPLGDNHMRPVTLRGLSPHHALVLVNGKRRHPASVLLAGPQVPSTGMTDLNAIPSGAIERIEVLRDGASAQYGSDAIGGVVNVILKSGKRREMQTSLGQVYSSEGGRDFDDGRLFDVSTTLGFTATNGGHITVTGELRDRDGTNRAYPDKRQQYFTGDPRNEEPAEVSSYLGNGNLSMLSFFVTAARPVTEAIEAYIFGGAADRNGITPDAFFRRPLDVRTVRALHPNGFLPVHDTRINDVSAVAGIRGSSRGWRWDLSSAWGSNSVAYNIRNSNNASMGTASPTAFYAGKVATQQWTSNADVSRNVNIGSFPLTVAGGAEVRVEEYQIRAGEPDSWRDGGARILDGPMAGQLPQVGAQGMLGYRPIDEVSPRRNSSAAYFEAEAQLLKRLLLQSAVRTEHYSDFGSTSDGKFAARMALARGVALRGSVSSGFRAPSLVQQYISNTRAIFRVSGGVNTILTVRTFPVTAPEAKLMGATPLKPERSLNWSGGLVLDRPRLTLITADFFQIDIDDRIGLGGAVTDTSITRLLAENGLRGVAGGGYFRNSRDTRTRGVDVVATHALLLGRTRVLRILSGYNQTRNVVTRVLPLPAQLSRFEAEVLGGRGGAGVIENGQPRETFTVTFNFSDGPVDLNLHNQRSGPTAQLDNVDPALDQVLRPKWITDLRLSYRLRSRVQLAVSVVNLFDTYPDEWIDFKDGLNARGVSMQGIFRYPGALSPFGMNGRTLYLRMAYR
jgi:iron complex outermembrane receptor protein